MFAYISSLLTFHLCLYFSTRHNTRSKGMPVILGYIAIPDGVAGVRATQVSAHRTVAHGSEQETLSALKLQRPSHW